MIKTKFTKIFDIITTNTKLEFNKFENQLEDQIENRNYIISENNQKPKSSDLSKIFEKNTNEESDSENEEFVKNPKSLNLIEEDVTILNIQLDDWDIYYLHLIIIEKFMQNSTQLFKKKLQKDPEFANKLLQGVLIRATLLHQQCVGHIGMRPNNQHSCSVSTYGFGARWSCYRDEMCSTVDGDTAPEEPKKPKGKRQRQRRQRWKRQGE